MKIILLKDVEHLGKAGDTTEVKEGYFRNYLLPRKLAVSSSTSGLRFLEAKKKQAAIRSAQAKEKAMALAAEIEKTTCVISARVGEEGKLFGSITNRNVEEELNKKGIQVDRKHIELAPIHELGEHQAKIYLHSEVSAVLKVSVVAMV